MMMTEIAPMNRVGPSSRGCVRTVDTGTSDSDSIEPPRRRKKIKLIKSKNDILPEVIPASQSKDSEPIQLDPLYRYHTSQNIHDDMDSSEISELDENEILRNVDNKNIYIQN